MQPITVPEQKHVVDTAILIFQKTHIIIVIFTYALSHSAFININTSLNKWELMMNLYFCCVLLPNIIPDHSLIMIKLFRKVVKNLFEFALSSVDY